MSGLGKMCPKVHLKLLRMKYYTTVLDFAPPHATYITEFNSLMDPVQSDARIGLACLP